MSKTSILAVLIMAVLVVVPRESLAEGAFALSQAPVQGSQSATAWNRRSAVEATEAALQSCQARGSVCAIVATVQNKCFAAAVQRGGHGWGWATGVEIKSVANSAIRECQKLGVRCHVPKDHAFCDTVTEVQKLTVCIRPIFEQELKLRSTIDGSSAKTNEVAEAILYLRSEFCRTTTVDMTVDDKTELNENCYEYSGMLGDERVYWGRCQD